MAGLPEVNHYVHHKSLTRPPRQTLPYQTQLPPGVDLRYTWHRPVMSLGWAARTHHYFSVRWHICHPYVIALENMPRGLRTYKVQCAMAASVPMRMNGPSGRWLVRVARCRASSPPP